VEEDKESGTFIQRGLSGEGFAVDVVDTGHDAFELAHHVDYDAIILNAFLPDMTSLFPRQSSAQGTLSGRDLLLSRKRRKQAN